jgi:membrane protease YdiL (CAAX protease family)
MIKNSVKVSLYSLLACGLLYYIEQGVGVAYVIKASLKIVLFLVMPILMMLYSKEVKIGDLLGLRHMNFKSLKLGLIVGGVSFVSLILLGTLFAPMIDFESLRLELSEKLHVTKGVFLFIALYITFVNSLLEEFFFRGFMYLSISKDHKKAGMLFSALLFGLYHMAMFQTWFPTWLVALCVVGLVGVGLFFNWVNDRSKTFMNSWVIHIIADSAIMIFAYKMLYL